MGHFHSENLDKLLLRQIRTKGSASINDLVALAEKKKEVLHTSEGTYDEKYMIQMGFETLVSIHVDLKQLEPILSTSREKKAFRLWQNNELEDSLDDNGESTGYLAIADSIKFEFSDKVKKSKYLEILIDEVES